MGYNTEKFWANFSPISAMLEVVGREFLDFSESALVYRQDIIEFGEHYCKIFR